MRVVVAVGCALVSVVAGCSSRSAAGTSAPAPAPAAAAVRAELIPGIGATRAGWDATHTPNAANNNGTDYGNDPSLPSYLTNNGAVYRDVDDQGTGRIQGYALVMHTVDAEQVLRQLRQELPSDARVAWHLTRDQCYRVAFNSPTLQAAGRLMAEAELQYIQQDGTPAMSPDKFNTASIFLEDAGTPPDPEKSC
ncbi:hypothetical protein [Mycobacterium sp.]|uniref:hypothetical protein n=1 Tax=Mycobacterium sp. TaxID=1785 RepID=UPI003BB0F776